MEPHFTSFFLPHACSHPESFIALLTYLNICFAGNPRCMECTDQLQATETPGGIVWYREERSKVIISSTQGIICN